MKFNKKILIPVFSAFLAVIIVFLVLGLTGKDTKHPSPAPKPATPTETTETITTTAPKQENILKMSFIGDCVIGGDPVDYGYESFIWFSENHPLSYFFEKVKGVLEQDDFTLANMETVLTDNMSLRPVDKGDDERAFWFMAKSKNAQILTEGSVEIAGVVNNHTYDFGDEGYSDTVKALENAGLMVGEDCSPLYFEKNGIKVGVVYAHLWGYYQVNDIFYALEEMQGKCDYKIVFFHGGEEGTHEPDNFKIDACRDLANSGLCDLIVGAHPHVLQPLEVVNDVPILYSLGNFCFAGNNYPENKTVIFGVNLTKDESGNITAETNIIPCYVYTGAYNTFQPAIIEDNSDKQEILDMLKVPVDYKEETEPVTTTSPETEPENEEEYIPDETEGFEDEYYPEEEYTEETEAGEEYIPEDEYIPEEDEYYEEEIETAISYY